MQNKLISHSLSTLRIIAISSLTIFTLYSVQAWVAPTVTPPNGNVAGPITTSSVAQTKAGDLTVNNLRLPAGGAIVTDPLATGNDKGMLNIFGQNSSLRAGLGFKDPVTSAFFGRIVSMDSGFYFLPGTDTSSSLIIGHGLIQVNGTTTTTNLIVTNGAGAGKVLTSDANGNATWQTPIGGSGAGCGGGYFIGGITANNPSTHGTVIKNVTTGQTLQVTLPSDVKSFALQGKGNDGDVGNVPINTTGYGGGASYVKAGTTWLIVAGGGGAGAAGSVAYKGGTGGDFGTKFSDGGFGMSKSFGGKSPSPYSTDGSSGLLGSGGYGGNFTLPAGILGWSGTIYGGRGGNGPTENGTKGAQSPFSTFDLGGYGGYGNAFVGGGSGLYVAPNGNNYRGGGGGGGGYGGGGGGVDNAGGGGGGSYLDPRNGWVCEGGAIIIISF